MTETNEAMRVSRCVHEWATDEYAASAEARALYEDGYRLATAEPTDYRAAAEVLQRAAELGSPRAAYALATWYLTLNAVFKVDFREARRLLKIAAAADIPEAHWDLAVMYENGEGGKRNQKRAFDHFLRAAIRGDADAVYMVGYAYFHGKGVRRSRRVARIWLDRAEELGLDRSTGQRRSEAS